MSEDQFIKYLKYEKRFSVLTVQAYEVDLRQFVLYLDKTGFSKGPEYASDKAIRSWIVDLLEEGYSTRSINRKISTLKSFYRFLLRKGSIQKNPMDKIVSPKVSKKLPYFVDQKDMNKLLHAPEFGNDFEGVRNRAIIETLYQTGIRLSELTGLESSRVNLETGSVLVLGKRKKERIIPLSNSLKGILKEYAERKEKDLKERDNPYFFLTSKGRKLYPKLVYRVINKYLQLVTTIEKKSPHVLRHSFATHMLNNGADLNAIKELLGHANLAATQVYTHNTFEKLKSIYNQAHPRA